MAGPLSVEDILARQKAQKEEASKPKFLTKADRAKIALQKRNAEVKEQQLREEEEKRSRADFERAAEEERRRAEEARYGGGGRNGYGGGRDGYGGGANGSASAGNGYGRREFSTQGCLLGGSYTFKEWSKTDTAADRYGQDHRGNQRNPNVPDRNGSSTPITAPTGPRGNGPPTGPRGMSQAQNGSSSSYTNSPAVPSPLATGASTPSSPKPGPPGDVAPPSDYELSTIRARYLGQKLGDKKPRLRKAQDKKINFDWKAEDDTTATEQGSWRSQVVGQGPGAVMLGGRLAGFDEGGLRRGQVSAGDK
jgi:ATP-dependent RNA helicase DDX23/PRP28